MTPQTGKQILTIHILPNISISKGNQTIKFGQLIGLKVRNIFLKKLPLYLRKTSGLYLISLYFDSPRLGYTITYNSLQKLGKQILTIHILPNTSISKGNQTIKFGQLIGLKVRNIFLKKLPLYLRKTSGLYLISLYFDSPRLGYTIKTTCIKLQAVDPRYV